MAEKLSVACPKPPSKVRALGARDMCAPQKQTTHRQQQRHRPPTNKVCYMPRNARNQRNKHNAVRGRQGENKYVTNRTTLEIYHKYTTKQCKPTRIGKTTTP